MLAHSDTQHIHFHRCCRFSLDTSFLFVLFCLHPSRHSLPVVVYFSFLCCLVFFFSLVVSHLVLLQFTTGVKVVCYFWPLCQVFPYFFILFNRNYLFSQSLSSFTLRSLSPQHQKTKTQPIQSLRCTRKAKTLSIYCHRSHTYRFVSPQLSQNVVASLCVLWQCCR